MRDDPGRSPQIELEPEKFLMAHFPAARTWTSGVHREKVSQIAPNFTVSLGSSQGTNPRTGGHSKRKRPLSEVFP